MRTLLASIASIALLGFATAAHATPIEYSITGTTSQGYSVSGTFSLDSLSSPEVFSSVDITEAGDILYDSIATQVTSSGDVYALISTDPGSTNPLAADFVLELSTTSGGNPVLCTGTCTDNSMVLFTPFANYTIQDQLVSGSIAQVVTPSATPEPSSLMLLGSGILGVAGVARRRFLKS